MTSYQMWHNKKPILKYLKIFGCTVYVHNKLRQTKFDEKAWKGVLLGYEANGYRVWDVVSNKVVIARDVKVDELNYGNSRPNLQFESDDIEKVSTLSECMTTGIENPAVIEQGENEYNNVNCKRIKFNEQTPECMVRTMSDNESDLESSMNITKETFPIENVKNPDESLIEIRRSERIKNLPKVSYNGINEMIMSAEIFISDIPRKFGDFEGRVDQKQWEKAIQDEINSLKENNTWEIVPRPTDKNIVGCRWVFVIKNDENGNSVKYKARLVAKSYSQEYLSDYEETFAPVARITILGFSLLLLTITWM